MLPTGSGNDSQSAGTGVLINPPRPIGFTLLMRQHQTPEDAAGRKQKTTW